MNKALMRQLEQFRRNYAHSSLMPVALVSADETRLDGWGTDGRPKRISSLTLYCRSDHGSAAVMARDDPNYAPCDLVEDLAMRTAASLDPERVVADAVSTR